MSTRIRPFKRGGWEVDIVLRMPDGSRIRERVKAPVSSKSAALRWGQERERFLLLHGGRRRKEVVQPKIPTLAEFAKRFIEGYANVENKASEVHAKQSVLDHHLLPRLGAKRLDAITTEDIDQLKAELVAKGRSAKTVNNVLAVLRRILRIALEWEVIPQIRARIRQLKCAPPPVRFYEAEQLEALLDAARAADGRVALIVLLGADAGLRLGEIMALQWSDVDFRRNQIRVERAEWHGRVDTPKGGRGRIVPMTQRLAEALRRHRHLRGDYVLCLDDGKPLDRNTVKRWLASAQRRANLRATGATHLLRHTFCSRLAAEGVAPRTIMELAGHRHLGTALRYMHVFPGAPAAAIRRMEQGANASSRGDVVETVPRTEENPKWF